jgi:hypothetical protein
MNLVKPETYHAALVGHHEGATVLDDLVARFDARMSFVAGGVDADRLTAYHEGQRSVVRFILETCVSVESGAPKFPPIL